MKYWLIIFFLDPQGEFISKREIQYPSRIECQKALARQRPPAGRLIETVCVSDDHYRGIKQDPGVDYD